jgi:hypothetical protein
MSTTNLKVTELDFLAIKENLKNYLKSQSEFQDYDFEAPSLNVLLDILSYNTHYNSYYLNMIANESFLDSAKIRQSVVSHAKLINYVPTSAKSSSAKINLEYISENNEPGTLTLPRGFTFSSNQIDDVSYDFVLLDDVVATKANSTYYFENLELYEGSLITYQYTYNELTNPKQIFKLPDENVDTNTIKIYVTDSSVNNTTRLYERAKDVFELNGTSEVFFVQESKEGFYEIYFGNDSLGKKLSNGNIVTIDYLITNSELANKANDFVVTFAQLSDSLSEQLSSYALTVVQNSVGGTTRETIDSIKFNAPINYATQNRLVTNNDYKVYLKQQYPNLESISVWGGEEETPPIYGKIFLSLKPKNNYFLSETEKTKIIEEILKPKSIISLDILIKDPEYLYLKLNVNVKYDKNKSLFTAENFKTQVQNIIYNYVETNVNNFEKTFVESKLQEEITDIDSSIIGVESSLRLEKRFLADIGVTKNYAIDFNQSLSQGTILNRLISDEFDVFDSFGDRRKVQLEEILQSYSGISQIDIVNPGSGYVTTPLVRVVGDGTGATAIAKVVNGRIESIQITNRGINYTKATVVISGGSGFGAVAFAVIDNKFGSLRTIYFNDNAERVVVNPNIGTINYATGQINLNNLRIVGTYSTDNIIKLNVSTNSGIIEGTKNTIVTLDRNDPSAVSINLNS